MPIQQISVFLENKCGRLASVARALGDHDINMLAFSVADTTDFGVLRLIVNRPLDACKVLQDDGFTVSTTEVLAVRIPDRPGGLAETLELMYDTGVNIEYMYAFGVKIDGDALAVFKAENTQLAEGLVRAKGIKAFGGEEVYDL
jgi:hypothetical protein